MNCLIAPQEEDAASNNSDNEILDKLYNLDDELTKDRDYFLLNYRKKENNNHIDNIEDYLGICNIPDLDTDKFLENGLQNSFDIRVIDNKQDNRIFQL